MSFLKDTVKRVKIQAPDQKTISANDISDKEFVSRLYTELVEGNNQKINPVKKR